MTEDRPHSRAFGELADELVANGLGFRFQARGRSMLPTIQDGEILDVRPVKWTSVKVGDIVLFRDGTEFTAHRVLRRKNDLIVTRGDSGTGVGVGVRGWEIVGKITSKICARTGETVRLEGHAARLRFVASEIRTQISRKVRRSFFATS